MSPVVVARTELTPRPVPRVRVQRDRQPRQQSAGPAAVEAARRRSPAQQVAMVAMVASAAVAAVVEASA